MTVLQRTDLTTSQKIQCAAAAVAGQHAHGSKTALSETYEISRPTVYAVGAAAQSVLRSHFESPLLQGAAVDVRVDDAQLRRAVVALRVLAPNAIRPIEDLVPLLYPGVKVSYGTIQQMLVEAEGRAARFNAQVSLGGVEAGALAHSGETDHRFRCEAGQRFRSNWTPVGAKRRGSGIMSRGGWSGSTLVVVFASILPSS